MTQSRKKQILSYCKEWQEIEHTLTIKDCFDLLKNDRMITSKEYNYLIDWMTI
tara:strand:+ start:415 stop:573 length:159 start_codon:yes stop_codon:yes gene_type:complete